MTALLDTAIDAARHGLAVVPPRQDGSKAPLAAWKDYQTAPPDEHQITRWYTDDITGIGVICGTVSGGLEMLEWEGRAVDLFDAWIDRCNQAGLTDLVERVTNGYCEHTPSGGVHLLYRCTQTAGNQKLARRPSPDELGIVDVLIETRGEGGYTICAPSSGAVHPTGGAWTIISGGFDTITTVTPDERAALLDIARSFDAMPLRPAHPPAAVNGTGPDDGERPGDWFTRTTTWPQILEPHGWVPVFEHGGETHWRRPGKTTGTSATTNYMDSDLLKVFTSSTDLDTETSYTRFAAWAVLEHHSDYRTAAREARRRMPVEPRHLAAVPDEQAPPDAYDPEPIPQDIEEPQVNTDPVDLADFLDPDIDDFLAGEEPPYEWVIPDVAEAGDRIILTGEEGKGKSTLLRQIGMQTSSGIHPFTQQPMPPIRVLLIDCENSRRQVRRKLGPIRDLVGSRYTPGQLRINIVGHALELAKPEIYNAISLRVMAHQPHVIIIGPLYKMTDGDPIKEEPARALADALDRLRAICGSALLIEAHTPYADGSRSKRPIRPYGASLWSRWPEFGIFLAPEGKLEHWRGARDERSWPTALERSQPWPWAVAVTNEPDPWDGPTECMAALKRFLAEHPDEEFTKTAIPDKLRARSLSYRDTTIRAALEKLAATGEIRCRKGARNSELYSYEPHPEEAVDSRAF